jgi:hypothetical protein
MGGAQYLNSEGTGRYEDHIIQEVMPFICKQYHIPTSNFIIIFIPFFIYVFAEKRWASFGISSGGYGAFMIAMRHPDLFACVADHSGDGLFDDLCKGMLGRV